MADEKVYSFDELDYNVQNNVRDKYYDFLVPDDWYEYVVDKWIDDVKRIVGIDIPADTIHFEVGMPGHYATFKYFFSTNDAGDMDVLKKLLDEALKDDYAPHKCIKALVLNDIYCGVDVSPRFRTGMGASLMFSGLYEKYPHIAKEVSRIEDIFADFLWDYFQEWANHLTNILEEEYTFLTTDDIYANDMFEDAGIYFDANGNEVDD